MYGGGYSKALGKHTARVRWGRGVRATMSAQAGRHRQGTATVRKRTHDFKDTKRNPFSDANFPYRTSAEQCYSINKPKIPHISAGKGGGVERIPSG